MSETQTTFDIAGLSHVFEAEGADAGFEKLLAELEASGDYHNLFDAHMLRRKHELGVPLTNPTSFKDVPDEKKKDFEETYAAKAREVGQKFLDEGKLTDAWLYFRVLSDPQPVRDALEQVPDEGEIDDEREELINLAVYQQVHPVKGLSLMLHGYGICNTITTTDQLFTQLNPEQRREVAANLVKFLYTDLQANVRRDVESRIPLLPPGESLSNLIAGREFLFEDDGYHIDVSHLNACVRFARSLAPDDPELKLAVELAEYGSHLAPQLQYPGEPPFDNFYPAHIHYFNAVLDENRDEALAYFKNALAEEPDVPDQQMIAFVLVDLLARCGQTDEAIELALEHLSSLGEDSGFSFVDFCREVGRMDALKKYAEQREDPVMLAAAVLMGK